MYMLIDKFIDMLSDISIYMLLTMSSFMSTGVFNHMSIGNSIGTCIDMLIENLTDKEEGGGRSGLLKI